jgi:hypothetical protein
MDFFPAKTFFTECSLRNIDRVTRDRYYDFLNIFAEQFGENIGVFLLKLLLLFAKI